MTGGTNIPAPSRYPTQPSKPDPATAAAGARRSIMPGWARAGLAIALAAATLGVAATATAAVPKSFYGVVPQAPLTEADFNRMEQGRVGTLRFELHWAGIDTTPSAGDYNWSASDEIVGAAASHGIQPLPFVYSTPDWVAEGIDNFNCQQDNCSPYAPRSKRALDAWGDFMGDAVARYGPNGDFWNENPSIPEMPIRDWQILNEQNSPTFYKPKPKVKAYAKVLKEANKAIAAEDRGAKVILGGMFQTPLQGRKPAIEAWNYLEKLYKVKGAKSSFDGVAAHPYAAKMKTVIDVVELFRDEMKDAHDKRTGLWITELGWASGGPKNPLNRGKAGQAQRLKEAFKYFTRKRGKLNVQTVNWYSWRDNPDAGVGLCSWCPQSGLFEQSLAPKPSWDAFTRFTGGS